jgi:lysyl endopeptidase
MRRTLTLLSLLWLPLAHATLSPDVGDLDRLPLHAAPAAATAKAISALAERKGSGPAIFAATVDLPVDLDGGVWDEIEPGLMRWRTRVYSAGARALLMEFGRFHLPDSARLWIYDADARVVQGPYSSADHNINNHLWTPTVPGETAVIELQVANADRDRVVLSLAQLGHAFKNARDLGDSQSCNIDTACPLGDNWRAEIRSTVKLQIPVPGGVGVCSGALINNLAQDDKPYVLTADHCGIGNPNSAPSSVVVYWNFQNSGCNTQDAPDSQNQTGTILRARDRTTDLSLLELSTAPAANLTVYLAGWDASGAGGSSGVSIHHPSGDAKKISAYTNALTQAPIVIEDGGPSIPAWRVTWNQGTTEQGSSGSGLWNQDRRIVGVLSGGSASCDNRDGPDFYARLDRQWLANPQAAGQLKAWLDPDNTGRCAVAGRNAGGPPAPLDQDASNCPTSQPTPTPTPTPPPDSAGGGGGGSLDLSLLGLLLGLGLLRRRRG